MNKAIVTQTPVNYSRNNGREYSTRYQRSAKAMLQQGEKHAQRLNEMRAKTVAYLGEDTGEILFA
jgi:hypothetical protein